HLTASRRTRSRASTTPFAAVTQAAPTGIHSEPLGPTHDDRHVRKVRRRSVRESIRERKKDRAAISGEDECVRWIDRSRRRGTIAPDGRGSDRQKHRKSERDRASPVLSWRDRVHAVHVHNDAANTRNTGPAARR